MQVIARRGACRVNDIAEELAITVGGTSKLVDRIEACGYCRRRPDPDDGRSSIIELTPAGRRLLNAATATLERELADRLGSGGLCARATTVQRHPDQAATRQQPCREHPRNDLDRPTMRPVFPKPQPR